MKIGLAVTVGDREGVLASKLEQLLPSVLQRFDLAAKATTATHPRVIALLQDAGIADASSAPDFNLIGRHRREALAIALAASGGDRIVYMDLDHVLRWIENNAGELDDVMSAAATWDCTVLGRGAKAFHALPERLASTETIVNRIYGLMTGRSWDLLMAARSLSRPAAEAILNGCDVETIGNDVAWPLFCEASGFSVGYLEAEGLTYKTNIDYAHDRDDTLDLDPGAWADRVQIAWQQVAEMVRYIDTS